MSFALLLGFLIGITHAFEADHLAAIASFSVHKKSLRNTLKQGYSWGFGHTATLFLVVVPVYLLHGQITASTEFMMELLVGLMLVYLGAALIYRLRRDRVHLHVHSHSDELRHFHAHSHKEDTARQKSSTREHMHESKLSGRPFGIGLVHGLAGSGALLVYAHDSIDQAWLIIPFVLLFGAGSIIGMTLVSKAISIPLRHADTWTMLSFGALKLAVAAVTVAIGLKLAGTSLYALLT